MKFWDWLTGADTRQRFEVVNDQAARFSVDEDSIPASFFGLSSYTNDPTTAPRVSRTLAVQVPAVKRSRDLIAGVLGTLPIEVVGPDGARTTPELFRQPEPDVPRSVTFAKTYEDMLFEGVAWWRIIEFGWHGYPTKVRRLDPRSVNVQKTGRVYVSKAGDPQGTAPEWVPDTELIRFDSPNDALLVAGARAIRSAALLDAAAARFSDGAPPLDYFTPAEGADPADDDEIVEMLDAWADARRTRSTGYVPAALKYNTGGWNPEQLQLADARQHAVLEIARTAGVDPEDLGVSTTSRTYSNQFDRRKQFTDFTQGGYRVAMEDRLSMPDVTPRGYTAAVNLSAFLLSDDKTRYEGYEIGLRVGAIDGTEEVRELEHKPPLKNQPAPAAPKETAAMDANPGTTFDTAPEIRLDAPGAQAFEVDAEKRTVRGLLVPYGVPASSNGQMWQFSKGTLKYGDVSRVKLWIQHDAKQAVGVAFELDDREDGLYGALRVARGAEGDRALALAEDGVLDGFSVGLAPGGKFTRKGQINHAVEAPLMEVSLTPAPSFDDARVHSVAASATQGETMPEATPTEIVETQEAPDFSSAESIAAAIRDGFTAMTLPPRETVPAGGAQFAVTEELPYRFDGVQGPNSFSLDMQAAANGDSEARQRIQEFLPVAFAVTTSGTTSLAPTENRPELYVPNLSYTRPLWDLVTKGSLDDKTPFTIPKFNAASGLVGDHTEGTEPTPGSFSATSQTVTPAPLSGKIEINREVIDQGGSPQADQIIWNEMLNGWYEAIEAKIAARLATTATAELNLAGAVDSALMTALTSYFSGLQFVRGGNRFTAFAADGNLFPALTGAKDGDGRPLLPILGPNNAQGTVGGGFDRVALGNQQIRAAWALGSGNDKKSYNFVPSSVYAWVSAPKRFDFQYQVKSVDMAIWGYAATAITRDSDVKPIDYTTSDTP